MFSICLTVKGLKDCSNILFNLDTLYDWYNANLIKLDVTKCKVMHFSKRGSLINFSYSIVDTVLTSVSSIKYFEFYLNVVLAFPMM